MINKDLQKNKTSIILQIYYFIVVRICIFDEYQTVRHTKKPTHTQYDMFESPGLNSTTFVLQICKLGYCLIIRRNGEKMFITHKSIDSLYNVELLGRL